MNEPQRVHVNFGCDPVLFTLSINIRKNKFIAYIYIRFNQNLDENSYISTKIEAAFLLTAEQRDVQSDYKEPYLF